MKAKFRQALVVIKNIEVETVVRIVRQVKMIGAVQIVQEQKLSVVDYILATAYEKHFPDIFQRAHFEKKLPLPTCTVCTFGKSCGSVAGLLQ